RERSDDRAALDPALAENHREAQMHLIADLRVVDKGAAVDPAALADHGFAAELRVGADHRVAADAHALVDVSRVRVFERDPGRHPFFVDALAQMLFHELQLLPAVDALDLAAVGHGHGFDFPALAQTDGDNIGQIIFALAIVVFDASQSRKQKRRRRDVNAGVDFADGALRRARVFFLDDGSDRSPGIAHDAAVAGGRIELSG